MELDFETVRDLIADEAVNPEFEVVVDRIFDAGDHGEVEYELILMHRDEVNSFWRTTYFIHYNDGMECGWNEEMLTFEQVQPVIKSAVIWEVIG